MPNWYENNTKITGATKEIARFKQTCINVDGELDFKTIIPMPAVWIEPFIDDGKGGITEKEPGAYERSCARWKEATGYDHPNDWATDHWGTKWDACDFYLSVDEPTCLECSFNTAWGPPEPVWKKMGEMFPMLTFELSGCELGMDFAFRGTIQDGQLEMRDALIEWSAVDPKTGKTICGPEELERVFGEDWSDDATYSVVDNLVIAPPRFFLTIKHDQIRISEIGDLNGTLGEFIAHSDKTSRVVSSGNDLHRFLDSKANEFGVSKRDLTVAVSSSLDFPEDETDDAATIALAHEIRDPDWEDILGPRK